MTVSEFEPLFVVFFFSVEMMKTRRLLLSQGYSTAKAFNAILK